MIATQKHNARDLFRLAWAQERATRLQQRRPDINTTSVRPAAEAECLRLEGVEEMSLRDAVASMQQTIRIELERT
jgi:hypothetical protein